MSVLAIDFAIAAFFGAALLAAYVVEWALRGHR